MGLQSGKTTLKPHDSHTACCNHDTVGEILDYLEGNVPVFNISSHLPAKPRATPL